MREKILFLQLLTPRKDHSKNLLLFFIQCQQIKVNNVNIYEWFFDIHFFFILNTPPKKKPTTTTAQLAEAVEYTDCISVEG